MAVFYDNGYGDIYAGLTRDAVAAEMRRDEPNLDMSRIFPVSGQTKMLATDENEEPTGELITLEDEYDDDTDTYVICVKP